MEKPNTKRIVSLVLKAVALGMSVTSIVLAIVPNVGDVNTHIMLLSIGLVALALDSLQKED